MISEDTSIYTLSKSDIGYICELLIGHNLSIEELSEVFGCDAYQIIKIKEDVFAYRTFRDNYNNIRVTKESKINQMKREYTTPTITVTILEMEGSISATLIKREL